MQSSMVTLIRQGANQPWGFRLHGGRDYGLPLKIQKIIPGSIAEHRNLSTGDSILQIGRERTVDMTHEDAQDAILRSGNRLDLLVLRPVAYKNHINKPAEQAHIRAIVHKQFNSPLGLYSRENIADSLISHAQVLTNGIAKGTNYKNMNTQTVRRTEVYRMVHEEDEEEESSSSSSASPSPTYMRRPAPTAPPKPAPQQQYRPVQPAQQQQQHQPAPQQQQYRQQAPQQQQRPQQPPPQQQPQQRPQQPPPQQQRPQQPPSQQQRPQQPPSQQQRPQQPPPQQQRPQQQPAPQPRPQQQQPPPPQQRQPQQPPQQQRQQQHYGAPQQVSKEPQNYYQPVQSQSNAIHHPGAAKPGPTFQSIIPVESSTQPHFDQVNWIPTQGHQLPVWPPQKSDAPIPTSSQSVKWSGSSGASKKFIWPPPKDYVEVREEIEGDQRRTIYTHVKDTRPNPARVYVSPRSPARLAAEAWEPYSKEYQEVIPPKSRLSGRPVRQFNELFASNSTRLPPTYRAPPGTSHIAA